MRPAHSPFAFRFQSSSQFNPAADPDLVGLWLAGDATDDGSTLTVPNRKPGGTSATATGAGRPTVSATALDGIAPGLVIAGSSVPLSAAVSLSGKTQCTVYCLAQNSTTTGATDVWMYGNAVQRIRCLYHNPLAYNVEVIRSASPSDATSDMSRFFGGFTYPSVNVFRFNTARSAPGENLAFWMDGKSVSTTQTNVADTTGSLGGGSLYIGCTYGGGSYFQGRIGAIAVIGREHTDAEVIQWTSWLRTQSKTAQARSFMWCGDSITVGVANNGGFRVKIQSLYDARTDGKRFYRTIGPNTGGYYLQDRFCAVSGQNISDLTTNISAAIGPSHDYHPDIIPLLIGTNDIGVGPGVSGMDTRYGTLLDTIASLEPSALIVAQALLPRSDVPAYSAAVNTWNSTTLPAVVTAAQTRGVNVILDTTISTTPGVAYSDGLHPTAAGYDTLGTALEPVTRTWAGVT